MLILRPDRSFFSVGLGGTSVSTSSDFDVSSDLALPLLSPTKLSSWVLFRFNFGFGGGDAFVSEMEK